MGLGSRFWRFWFAAVLANVGDGIRVAAFPLLTASLTQDPTLVGLVAAASTLPWLLTGLAAGSMADRRDRRVLVAAADLGRVAVLVVLVTLLLLDRASVPVVVVAAFLLGVGETFRDTAAQAIIPRLVPKPLLERANGRLVAGEVMGNEFVGPLAGAALFAVGVAVPFVANSAALAVAVLLVLSLPAATLALREVRDDDPTVVPPGIRAGARWLARHPLLRTLVGVGVLVAIADSAWFAVLVLYVQERLTLGAVGFGVLLAAGAGGGMLGALVADRLVARHRHRAVLGWSVVAACAVPLLLVVRPERWVAVVVVVVTSGAFGVFNVAAVSLRHRLVPDALLGRVTATWRTAVYGAAAAGAVAGGLMASARGLDAPFVLSAILGVVAAALWWAGTARITLGPA